MTDDTTPRDELIKLIAWGKGCGGEYSCAASGTLLPDEIADAEKALAAYREQVGAELAAKLRAHPEYRGVMGIAADLVERETQR